MLTFFTTLKPFRDQHISLIQRNAVKSWLSLPIENEVILLGNDKGVKEFAKKIGVLHIPEIECNEFGTPLVSSLFEIAQRHSKYNILIYINADIILMSRFATVFNHLPEDRFLLIGRRWDLEVSKPIDFSSNYWEEQLKQSIAESGILRNECTIDYFCFKKGLWKSIPPFAIGRFRFDRWLIYDAIVTGAKVIEASDVVMVVHQNHDYRHLPNRGLESEQAAEELKRNRELYPKKGVPDTIWDAKYILAPGGIRKRRLTREHFNWRLQKHVPGSLPFLSEVVYGLFYPEKLLVKILRGLKKSF